MGVASQVAGHCGFTLTWLLLIMLLVASVGSDQCRTPSSSCLPQKVMRSSHILIRVEFV